MSTCLNDVLVAVTVFVPYDSKFRKVTIMAPRELKDFLVVLPDNVPNMWIKHSTENARSDKY